MKIQEEHPAGGLVVNVCEPGERGKQYTIGVNPTRHIGSRAIRPYRTRP